MSKPDGPRPLQDILGHGRLGDLLSRAADTRDLTRKVRASLSRELADHVVSAHLEEGRLTIFTDASTWASRLRFEGPALCRTLAGLHDAPVEEVAVRVAADRRG